MLYGHAAVDLFEWIALIFVRAAVVLHRLRRACQPGLLRRHLFEFRLKAKDPFTELPLFDEFQVDDSIGLRGL